MNSHMIRIAKPVKWAVIENFYKDVEGGSEKVAKMKAFCKSDRKGDLFDSYMASQMRYALVNYEFLYDRRQKMNAEFEWSEENKSKLVRFDNHIKNLQLEIYETFKQTKEHLDSRIDQGAARYKDYQVEAAIYPGDYWDIQGVDEGIALMLMWFADWENMGITDSFGEGQSPTDPLDENSFATICAWNGWLAIPEFVENGVTTFLDSLLCDAHVSLYSFQDIVNMDPKQFQVTYNVTYYGEDFGWRPKNEQ